MESGPGVMAGLDLAAVAASAREVAAGSAPEDLAASPAKNSRRALSFPIRPCAAPIWPPSIPHSGSRWCSFWPAFSRKNCRSSCMRGSAPPNAKLGSINRAEPAGVHHHRVRRVGILPSIWVGRRFCPLGERGVDLEHLRRQSEPVEALTRAWKKLRPGVSGSELPHLQVAGVDLKKLQAGKFPPGGDDSWQDNLEAAAISWKGKPPAPPVTSARPALSPIPARLARKR